MAVEPIAHHRRAKNTYTVNEIGRKLEDLDSKFSKLDDSFDTLVKKLYLYGGILVGAMAASGLITKGAGEVIKHLFGILI